MIAQRQFVGVGLLGGDEGVAQVVAHGRLRHALVRAFQVIDVLVLVDVDVGVGMEVDGVGAGGKGAVVVLRIEDLHGQSLPAAGRAAINKPRPALADSAKLLFDGRNQLCFDGVAIGAHVGRVHGVGVVIEGVGVLNLDDQHPRKARRNPLLIELVGLLLLDAVVAGQVEALAVVGLQIRVGRRGAEVAEIIHKMVVKDDQREARVGVLVEALGHQHDGAQEHRPAPEFGQQARSGCGCGECIWCRPAWGWAESSRSA